MIIVALRSNDEKWLTYLETLYGDSILVIKLPCDVFVLNGTYVLLKFAMYDHDLEFVSIFGNTAVPTSSVTTLLKMP